MLSWLRQLDALLRGQSTNPNLLEPGAVKLTLRWFVVISLVLGGLYGFFMGWYSVLTHDSTNAMQLLASTVKLPLLFLLTLVIAFPSLYVFSALSGCRLSFAGVLRLLVETITINLAVAASMGPILGFFTLSTESYPFMVVLNVVLLAIAGVVSLGFLLRVLRRLAVAMSPVSSASSASPAPSTPFVRSDADADLDLADVSRVPLSKRPLNSSPSSQPGHVVFSVWIVIYGLVGAQMGWLLRPFIGNPHLPFTWFRPRGGNFFESVWGQLTHLLGPLQ